MAIQINGYNHNAYRFAAGLNPSGDSYKILLVNATATFDPTHTELSQVTSSGANEVVGGGWPQGGVALTGIAISAVGADNKDAMFDAGDVLQLITGASLGPFKGYVIYNATDANNPPVAFISLPSTGTIPPETYFSIIWPTTGIVYFAKQ